MSIAIHLKYPQFVIFIGVFNRDVSLDIHLERRKSEKEICESSDNTTGEAVRHKLYISRKVNIFLNVNAVILLCVFVFLYCMYH